MTLVCQRLRWSLARHAAMLLLVVLLTTACSADRSGGLSAPTIVPSTAQAQDGTLQPVLAPSEVVVGPNRLALGLLSHNVPINDADQTTVHVLYYKLDGKQATLVGE